MTNTPRPMAEQLDVMIEDDRWNALDLEGLSDRAIGAAFAQLGLTRDGYEISILACDDAEIARLNTEFRGKEKPTNVLSWPAFDLAPEEQGGEPHPAPESEDGPFETSLGDIAISYDTCMKEAAEQGLAPADHVIHLLIHATFHLLGYDHETDADAELMEALEIKTLETLNIANPY